MKLPRITAAERTGLILLAIAIVAAAIALILARKPDATLEQPANPVAIDSLSWELRADSVKSAPIPSASSVSRSHLDEGF